MQIVQSVEVQYEDGEGMPTRQLIVNGEQFPFYTAGPLREEAGAHGQFSVLWVPLALDLDCPRVDLSQEADFIRERKRAGAAT